MTRMWMVNPKILCKNHLLGEHCELHKAYGGMIRNRKIDNYLKLGQLEPLEMKHRHDELVIEMQNRGYNHNSPFTNNMQEEVELYMMYNEYDISKSYVDNNKSLIDLKSRCINCSIS